MSAPEVATLLPAQLPQSAKDVTDASAIDVLKPWSEPRHFIQSPYTELKHQLDLATLDYENALFAKALASLDATRDDYATAPYAESFNWDRVLSNLKALVRVYGEPFRESSFYIVAFRSQIKPSTDYSHLGELDKAAHLEAVESGGFLKYWFGSPDPELRNLATCVWRSREDAMAGGRGPAHKKAAMSTRSLYAYWKIDQHRLIIRKNVEDWELVPWTD
ncbi:hypothetical protein K4F52_001837 [Lecanicillium sp. MT-2017a]|nr:hypothetical protein K4F52_001837 [Lecanicillium sp. MT-2017a]